jgi:hypothetical protein
MQEILNFNQEMGLAAGVEFIIVNGGNFTPSGAFRGESVTGEEVIIPKKLLDTANFNADTIFSQFPFFVLAKKRNYQWYVDGANNIVSNPTPEQQSSGELFRREIVDQVRATLIFKTEEEAEIAFASAKGSKVRIHRGVAKRTKSLKMEVEDLQEQP